jgi:farnesyl diphosphate synthase
MTFEKRLGARAASIDAELGRLMASDAPLMAGTPERLQAAMRHAVMGGGKRLRPFLVLETAAVFGASAEAAMPAAIALELIHCYSLVHDDLPAMDNDELRRGQPTVWRAFDDWTAILAGDALLTLAFEVLAQPPGAALSRDAARQLTLVRLLARASGAAGMVGGQTLDLEADKLGQPPAPTVAHIRKLQSMKTGALFSYACEAGAVAAGAKSQEISAMSCFGAALGAAFQLADDLLDVEGDAAVVGKATGKDAAAGKATLIGLMGLDAARASLADIERQALAVLAGIDADTTVLAETLHFTCSRSK